MTLKKKIMSLFANRIKKILSAKSFSFNHEKLKFLGKNNQYFSEPNKQRRYIKVSCLQFTAFSTFSVFPHFLFISFRIG